MNETQFALRLSQSQRDRLQAAADQDKRPLAQMIRLLLDQALDARERRIEARRAILKQPEPAPEPKRYIRILAKSDNS